MFAILHARLSRSSKTLRYNKKTYTIYIKVYVSRIIKLMLSQSFLQDFRDYFQALLLKKDSKKLSRFVFIRTQVF